MNFKFSTKEGLTIIELIAVVAIIAVLAMIAWGTFYSLRGQSALDSAAENIVALLNQARAKTLASEDSSEFGLHFETAKAVMFKGTVYSSASPDNEVFNLPSPVEISAVSFVGGGNDVFFEKFSGSPSRAGSITLRLKSDASRNKNIIISSTGVVYASN